MTRYVASTSVEHGCCYTASVRDTKTDIDEWSGQERLVAECPTLEDAEKIAAALNAQPENSQ